MIDIKSLALPVAALSFVALCAGHGEASTPQPAQLSAVLKPTFPIQASPILVRAQLWQSVEGLSLSEVGCRERCGANVFLEVPDQVRGNPGVKRMFDELSKSQQAERRLFVKIRVRIVYKNNPPRVRRLELLDAVDSELGPLK